jgi:hypothetical protein
MPLTSPKVGHAPSCAAVFHNHLLLAHKPAPSFKTLNEVFGKWLAHGFLERNCATRPRDWSQGKM